jgi:hypothetical protein
MLIATIVALTSGLYLMGVGFSRMVAREVEKSRRHG